jgi:DNA invertase Pin-like site-specific DNA recombinase
MSGEKAFGYVRLSQGGRDTSIEDQKEALREYAREHPALQLVTTINDGENTSGFNEDRDGYQTIREKIEADDADAVIVRDRARLSRDFDERLRLIAMFRASDCDWHVVEAGGRIELEDVQTAAMECVHAAMDHAKKMAEIRRSKEAVQQRMDDPDVDHGRPRFGMTYDDQGRRQVPGKNFETVREILREDKPDKSRREIASAVDVPVATVHRVLDRREWYLNRSGEAVGDRVQNS